MKKNTAAKAELWADRIRDFQDSGLSHKEWCQKHEIALPTYPYSTLVAVDNQLDNSLKNSALLHEVFGLIFWVLLLRSSRGEV